VVIIVVVVLVIALGTSNGPSHPPLADVKITSCAVDATTRLPSAGLEIHNHTSKASTYGKGQRRPPSPQPGREGRRYARP
jgi:hypothetical protein